MLLPIGVRRALLAAAIVAGVSGLQAASADCTADGTTSTCTGDFGSGLTVQDEVPADTTEVKVNSLTADIPFIAWTSSLTGGDQLSLIVNTGDFTAGSSTSDRKAVSSIQTGSNGSDGEDEAGSDGHIGGTGVTPDGAIINFTGTAVTSGSDSSVLYASSTGGSGGEGGTSVDFDGGAGGSGGEGGQINLNVNGTATASGSGSYVVYGAATGGSGGGGGDSDAGTGGAGGSGGGSGTVILTSGDSATITATNTGVAAIYLASQAGKGGNGKGGADAGGEGGAGGLSDPIQLNPSNDGNWTVTTTGDDSPGFQLLNQAGNGGDGGQGDTGKGGAGGTGGNAGNITSPTTTITRTISTNGTGSAAFVAASVAGNGGTGGDGETFSDGGDGGLGGNGGEISLDGTWIIETQGSESGGILLNSLGGAGGQAGNGGIFADGGTGGDSGTGGEVKLVLAEGSSISTTGGTSSAIVAQSISGYAGTGGLSTGFVTFGASGGSAGSAGAVTVTNNGTLTTTGDQSNLIVAQSIGGGGGNGGDAWGAFYASTSGERSLGGAGGDVTVTNTGNLTSSGNDASAILAQSISGTGGNAGTTVAISSLGGGASNSADAGDVVVTNSGRIVTGQTVSGGSASGSDPVCTTGCSHAIAAQSIGGGGGNGGTTFGWFSIGGNGGAGGNAGTVTVSNDGGDITTNLDESVGILAQSIGGGGGRGSGTMTFGAAVSVAVGGSGGDGGDGADVVVSPTDGTQIGTSGFQSYGIHAQSIGGGGGNSNFTGSGSFSVAVPDIAVAVGGSGGSGGSAGSVTVDTVDADYDGSELNAITTTGDSATAILAQSVGGGGGNGGFTFVINGASGASASSFAVAVGGSGGSGGDGGAVAINSDVIVQTAGSSASGLVAQSIGGGGGNGSAALSGASTTGGASLSVALGGSGGDGGDGSTAAVTSIASITTLGTQAPGIVAQSIGGGGGTGGMAIAGTIDFGSPSVGMSFAIGGSGAAGGSSLAPATGTTVTAQASGGQIATAGYLSTAILAQSIGGGGGNGGLVVDGTLTSGQAINIGLGMGGSGGAGGSGSSVGVTNASSIVTLGDLADGIFAQSIGGGGGNGGMVINSAIEFSQTVGLSVAIGGGGGIGGTGGAITVTNSGGVAVAGTEASGVVAQSVGGGGGRGGFTGTFDLTGTTQTTHSLTVAVGGDGGNGATGGSVTLANSGTLLVTGAGGQGLVAQSIGGGGGNGGSNFDWSLGPSSGLPAEVDLGDFSLGVGGTGGIGGHGGTIVASNSGAISTGTGTPAFDFGSTYQAHGIVLQSVGGGGGNGGLAFLTNIATIGEITPELEIGGGGGTSGEGGNITLTSNSGAIATADYLSHGIYAQSVAGGGGNGVLNIEAEIISFNGAGLTFDLGGGGDQSDGGTVSITNDAGGNITVAGDYSMGILAQSIGGGGGNGILALSGDLDGSSSTATKQVGIDVGSSGDGGNGGSVSIANAATVVTGGSSSNLGAGMHGLYAQSVGGGGGIHAAVIDGTITTAAGGAALSLTMGLGGSGAGSGNQVSVTSTGQVWTQGDASIALFAQSVGGGGGFATAMLAGTDAAGNAAAVSAVLGGTGSDGGAGGTASASNSGTVVTGSAATQDSLAISGAHGLFAQSVGDGGGTVSLSGSLLLGTDDGVTMTLGANAGSGAGGSATATNSGAVTTWNNSSHGLFAQSVGGGGGSAGSLGGMGATTSWNATVSLGGGGGSAGGGAGGSVTISNGTQGGTGSTGQVTTAGDGSFALFAQSVGAGGGDAADASGLGSTADATQSTANATIDLQLGGTFLASGAGGTVQVTHLSGALSTGGVGATAIFAQSVGGGGGRAGSGALAAGGSVNVGGTDGVTGNGGAVTVTVSGGSIAAGTAQAAATGVVGAYGIFAQSVGGGGGIAGNVLFGSPDNFGSGLAMNADGDDSTGAGGSVFVTTSAGTSITTFGNSSIGIFAQSVGGGGGVKGEVGSPTGALIGSNGGSGTAGDVTLEIAGDVSTGGANAHAIFAQAAATDASPNSDLSITVDGDVSATGAGAHGIFAQSDTQTGGIGVTIGGSVSGGAAAADASLPDGAGVYISSDVGLSFLTIESGGDLSALSGTAIRTDDVTLLQVSNSGTVTGSVYMETSQSLLGTFTNETGGLFNEGATVEADVVNDGTIDIVGGTTATFAVALAAPEDPSDYGTSIIAGDLDQNGSGKLIFDVNFDTLEADRLEIEGAAVLDGEVTLRHHSILPNRTLSLLIADGGLTQQGIDVTPSAIFSHALSQQGNELFVSTTGADFRPEGFDLSKTAGAVADALQDIWDAGANSGFGALFPLVGAAADAGQDSYEDGLRDLSPGAALAIGAQQWADMQSFADGLLSCPEFEGDTALVVEGQCAYARVVGRHSSLNEIDGVPGSTTNSVLVQGGAQFELAPEWFLLGSLGYEYSHLDGDGDGASATGNSGYLGVAVKWQSGPWLVGAGVSGGYGAFDIRRDINLGGENDTATATQKLLSAGFKLRGAYTFTDDAWYLRPSVDLDVIYTHSPAFSETGSEPVNLDYEAESRTTVVGTPAVEVGRRFDLSGGMALRAYLQGGVSVLSNDDWSLDTTFDGAPDGTGSFSTSVSTGNVVGRVAAGVQLMSVDSFDVRLRYEGSFSGDWTSHAGVLTGALHF